MRIGEVQKGVSQDFENVFYDEGKSNPGVHTASVGI
jgi:hypothetical protein